MSQAPAAETSHLAGRIPGTPMDVVETYLQEYQPGPLPRIFQSTKIYDRHGALIGERFEEGRRSWVTLGYVSSHLIDATISTEDSSFYTNSGVDPARIAGAALQNLQEGTIVSGASTITMQLARNLFLTTDERYDRTVDRKVLEAELARELTKYYSKDEILEMYLNLLNYGQLAYGPEAAAQVYFGKSAADLTLAEASLLAGIPQQPARLNPYQDFEAAKERQRVVLDVMVRHKFLTDSQADAAFSEELTLSGDLGLTNLRAPHFVQFIVEQLEAEFGAEQVRRSGFHVQTTLDADMQEIAQRTVTEKVAELLPVYDLGNAALVALKPPTNEILAMVGSADFTNDEIAGQVNVAISLRQPGSAIKPILYATALDDALVSPASVLWDVPVTYTAQLPTGPIGSPLIDQEYRPHNYDNEFHGPVTVRTALASSYNVPTVKLLSALGVDRMLESAHAMGVTSLAESGEWYGLSLTLGGGEVTLLDLATAFHTLADHGNYRPPQSILAIHDSQGRPIEWTDLPAAETAISPEAAFLVTDILSDNAARATAFGADSPLALSRPAAAKTGTTSDWRDNWTVGYTRYLVAGVWAGNSDGRPMRDASGVTGAAPIWHDFMEAVLADPAMLASLDAPEEAADWRFPPDSQVSQLTACPPRVVCRQGGEFYTDKWLQKAGESGPLSDSVLRAPAAPVYVEREGEQRLAGFCTEEGAAQRTLLRLSGELGLSTADANQPEESSAVSTSDVESGEDDFAPQLDLPQEVGRVVSWALRHPAGPVDFGPCSELGLIIDSALTMMSEEEGANLRVLVDYAVAADTEVGEYASLDAVEVSAFGDPGVAQISGNWRLAQPVYHDVACPGEYVMGQVLAADGSPVAGVRIAMYDQWGNRSIASSKGDAGDMGRFDFPVFSNQPHELYLNVVDEGDNPLSMTVVMQHRQGEEPDAPCHHVVFQAD